MSALVKIAWELRPVTFVIGAWQSVQDGPPMVGEFGAAVLLGLLAASYLPAARRRKLNKHQFTAPVPDRVQSHG